MRPSTKSDIVNLLLMAFFLSCLAVATVAVLYLIAPIIVLNRILGP